MENNLYEEEISLRELIEILLKGWKLIITVPIICGLMTYMFSFYMIQPTYESSSLLEIHAGENYQNAVTSVNSIDEALNAQPLTPAFSMESYIKQITSPEVILLTLEQLDLVDTYTYEQFIGKIDVLPTKNSSLITITVKDNDAETASKIVNTLSAVFMNYVSEKKVEQLNTSTDLLTTQLTIEKKKLDAVLLEIKTFNAQENNLSFLQQELNLNNSKLQKSKSELVTLTDTYNKSKYSLEQDIKLSKSKIIQYKNLLKETEEAFTLSKDIFDSNIGTTLVSSENIPLNEQIHYTINSDELNPVYVSTLQMINTEEFKLIQLNTSLDKLNSMYKYNYSTLTDTVEELETIITTKRIELSELEYQKKLLDQQLQVAEDTYKAFNNKLESARVAKAANISKTSVMLMSEGIIPSNPVGPRKMLNTLIGVVLSGMLVVFYLFFKSYWNNTTVK